MRPILIFATWLLTLVIGLFIASVVFQGLYFGLIFSAIAGLGSLPYLIIMIIFSFVIQDFWKQQVVHAVTTVFTIMLFLVLDEDYISDLFWVPSVYFILALAIQYLVYKNTKAQLVKKKYDSTE